jgi:hypothetical protein
VLGQRSSLTQYRLETIPWLFYISFLMIMGSFANHGDIGEDETPCESTTPSWGNKGYYASGASVRNLGSYVPTYTVAPQLHMFFSWESCAPLQLAGRSAAAGSVDTVERSAVRHL